MSGKIQLSKHLKNLIEKFVEKGDCKDEDLVKCLDLTLKDGYIKLNELKKFVEILNEGGKDGQRYYIHELLTGCDLYLPKYEETPRNAELEARIQLLKARFAEEDYQRMVKDVDVASPLRYSNTFKEKLSVDFRTAQGQLIAILNMVIVILASFVFGYKSIEYSLDRPNYTLQIVGGFVLALIVAIADVYFLFKRLIKLDNKESKQANQENITKKAKLIKHNRTVKTKLN